MTRPEPSTVDLVIFDLDGVLVDVQHAENGALAHLAERMGLHLSVRQAAELFSGRRLQECIDLIERMSLTTPPADAVQIVRAKCEDIIGRRIEPIDGVDYALRRIKTTKCVASNSPPEIIERRLETSGIAHHFGDRRYSAYDINAWKPDPRLFLWAADDLGAQAERSVVVEDSAVGVAAGLAAGMRVLQFTGDGNTTAHPSGVLPFSSMRALPRLVGGTL